MTTQLRLLAGGDLPRPVRRTRTRRADVPTRPAARTPIRLAHQTREIGLSGVAEARRRLAEINATTERVHELVRAS